MYTHTLQITKISILLESKQLCLVFRHDIHKIKADVPSLWKSKPHNTKEICCESPKCFCSTDYGRRGNFWPNLHVGIIYFHKYERQLLIKKLLLLNFFQ